MNAIHKFAVLCIVAGAVLTSGPAFGFGSLAADRGIGIAVTDNENAYLTVEPIDTVVTDQNDPEEVIRITNNFDETLALETDVRIRDDGLEEASSFDGELPAGEGTTYAVTCKPGSGSGTTRLEVTVRSASGKRTAVDGVTETITVQRDCPGRSPPGQASGFDSIDASDVSGFVDAGEERQEFRFTLAGSRQPNEQIEIDLRDPRDDGVDYDGTFYDGDVRVERGHGTVWTSGDSLVYQVSSKDKHADEIVLSAGSYATDGDGGPYDVVFTRRDTNEAGTTQFEIDGVEGGDEPFMDVTATDIHPDDERQTFGFTPGQGVDSWEYVRIDVSDPEGSAVDYDWDVRLEGGPGSDDNVWREGDEIVYQSNAENDAGDDIRVSIGIEVTEGGGPYDVTFTRTDTGDRETDAFEIAGG
ncbi:hypothetical protein [Halopiger djelfimassiliensis]|uniref:hypothetical protein n=1 Tax=Halopiger djelfimassiliensis TaxID=1293047 RepID=UPI000677B01F|nr:hypothetical protein [Halopiger djelfimassiliensis]